MLIKLDRISAWVLFVTLILYFVTGYGMTKGLIDPLLARSLHLSLLTYIVVIAFAIHTSYAIHLALIRWNFWNNFSKILMMIFYVVILFSFIYVDQFYKVNRSPAPVITLPALSSPLPITSPSILPTILVSPTPAFSPSLTPSPSASPSLSVSPTSTQRTFTLAQLSQYNGKNGQPAYGAVDGKVYDLSAIFFGGSHYGYTAGQDLSAAFHNQHAKSFLSGLTIVGILIQ